MKTLMNWAFIKLIVVRVLKAVNVWWILIILMIGIGRHNQAGFLTNNEGLRNIDKDIQLSTVPKMISCPKMNVPDCKKPLQVEGLSVDYCPWCFSQPRRQSCHIVPKIRSGMVLIDLVLRLWFCLTTNGWFILCSHYNSFSKKILWSKSTQNMCTRAGHL